MDFYDTVRKRRMTRNLARDPIAHEVRDRILDAMQRGPSAGFSQGFEFLVLEGDSAAAFWDIAWPEEERDSPHAGVTNAPLVIVPCADKQTYLDRYAEPDKGWTDKDESHWPVPYWIVDTAFASMIALLAVVAEDLGALFFGLQRESAIKNAFGIPAQFQPIGAIAIGHRAPDVPSPSLARGHRTGLVHHSRW
jgi:nitroreductase